MQKCLKKVLFTSKNDQNEWKMAVLKWYCGECRKVLQVKMTFFVCIFRSKNIIFVPSAVRDCVSKVLVFLFHIYKMKKHKLLRRFSSLQNENTFLKRFSILKHGNRPFEALSYLKNAKTRFWSVFFIFKKWKSSFLNCFLSSP